MTQVLLERFESPSATALHRPEPDAEEAEALRAEEEANAAHKAAEAARIAREQALTEAISELGTAVANSRSGALQAICAELGEALAGTLPELLDAGFAEEAAIACADLAVAGRIAGAELRTSPGDAELLVAALQRLSPEQPIAVVPDQTMPDGQVRLDWGGGGAVFDADAWAQQVKAMAAARIDARKNEGVET